MQSYEIQSIGTIESPYKQKFAIPRQPKLIPEARAKLIFHAEFCREEFVRGLEAFSHIWLLFRFHETADKGWSPMVRPPRLGGNEKKGVFATRSTFRPNAIGMSAVNLKSIEYKNKQLWLELGGIDLLDGTPILDIKPYLTYSDSISDAQNGYAQQSPISDLSVEFSEQALHFCQQQKAKYPELLIFIEKVLLQDPRPAYKKQQSGIQEYGMSLYHFNIRWQVSGKVNTVIDIRVL